MLGLFQKAVPWMLMDKNEYAKFTNLDDIITVYRGVTSYNAKNVKVLSWTMDVNIKCYMEYHAANRVEKVITEQGFEVRRMKKEDIKRFLAIYFDASMSGELMPDTDGEQFSAFIDKDSVERVK